jgi:hypothetical protein
MEIFLTTLAKRAQDYQTTIFVFRAWEGDGHLRNGTKSSSWLKDMGKLGEAEWIKYWL